MAYLTDRLRTHGALENYDFVDAASIVDEVLNSFKPPPKIKLSDWAEEYRRLSSESSASPGRFRFDKTPYMREPHDMVGQPGIKSIAMMCSAQVGKSTFIENACAYHIHLDPCPILHISPTLDSMKMFSKERLAPMIRDTPVLKNLVRDARTRDSGNTIASKKFPGGHIAMVGSNSPSGLASRPVRILVADEVDRFERSAGTEGDPLQLGIKRTTTYWNRVLIFVSTPGEKYDPQEKTGSRIEKEFLDGDQRHYHGKCPHCGEYQKMKWSQVQWDEDEHGNHDPSTAVYICEHNGCIWDDQDRAQAILDGVWIAEKPFNGKVSYCLSQLHSLFAPLSDGVTDFLSAKSDPEMLKTWVNTFLGQPWEDKGVRLEWSNLKDQREDYDPSEEIHEDIVAITAGIDVQDDRIEYEIIGWGDEKQSWQLEYGYFYADDSLIEDGPWIEMAKKLTQTYMHPLFGEMAIRNAFMDSGGHFTDKVYKFCEHKPRCQAIKGVSGFDKPAVGRPMKRTKDDARVYPLGVDTIKQQVVGRLNVRDSKKPGYCTWPMSADDEYFKGVTAEELKTKYVRGRKKREWTPIRKRNEPFDIRVYGTAALEFLSISLKAEKRRLLRDKKKRDNPPKKKPKRRRPRAEDNWAESFKYG